MITAEELKELLHYDPETGRFTWIKNFCIRKAGEKAGRLDKTNGYMYIYIFGKSYKASRLAWLYITSNHPGKWIDHKNGIRDDNRWDNLRECTPQQNQFNRRVSARSTVQHKGIYIRKSTGKYEVGARINGKKIHLGFFHDIESAEKAYEDHAKKHHGEFICNR